MKKLLLVTIVGLAVLAFGFTAWNPFDAADHVAVYKPRSAQKHIPMGAHGWIETQIEMKKNYFTGQVEPEDLLLTRRAVEKRAEKRGKDNDMEWNSLGPDNIGGRTRGLWIDPTDDDHLIGGGVSGGLWQSFNAGNTWEPITSFNKSSGFFQHMTITCITRTGSGIYYVGTGTQHEGGNASGVGTGGFVGGGVFRSTNTAGTEWEQVNDFTPDPFDPNSEWSTVDAIVVDPNDQEKLWIAHSRGLDIYFHGNDDLETRPSTLPQTFQPCEDVHISTDGSVIVASIGSRGYLSTDGGQSFEAISGAFENSGANFLGQGGNARVEFAISPSDPDYIYATATNTNNSLRGVAATFDRGETWYRIAADVNQNPSTPFQPFGGVGGQGVWDNCIIVNPLDPKEIYVGGLIIYSHKITGDIPALSNWEVRSIYSLNYTNPFAVHPDIHWFRFDSNNVFYACTDGGFFKSTNLVTGDVPTFFPVNQGYVTTQFYGIAHGDDGRTLGGTQDNSTLYQTLQGSSPNQGAIIFTGDGFDCEISTTRPELLIGTSQNGPIYRSVGAGFGEVVTTPAPSVDFTTNIRLVETDNDPYSTRGSMWGADTLFSAFVADYQEWENGDITLGYIPEGYSIQHNAAADQRELWTTTEEDLYYYQRKILRDTLEVTVLDTVDVEFELEIIDSVVTPIDTNFVLDCDTLDWPIDTTFVLDCDTLNIPFDTTFVDSCIIFLGELVCITIDTTYANFMDSVFCDVTDTNVTFIDSVFCDIVDTTIVFDTDYSYDTTFTYITEEVIEEVIDRDTLMFTADSILLVDPVQSLFVSGNGTGNGIWVTRDILNTSIDPEYWNVANTNDFVNCLEWSPDRDHLYVGTAGGRLFRVSGFNQVYHAEDVENLETQTLITSGAPISDIAVDYSQGTGGPDADPASEMVVVTRSTYGTTDKVLVSMNAASTSSTNSFSSIWNIEAPLDRMPAYACVINKEDPDVIVIGTEVGIFRTTDGGDNWSEENGGLMDRAPVYDLRQQYKEPWQVQNSGIIYAGTHGRGIFENDDYFSPNTGIEDNAANDLQLEAVSGITIFPNPMNTTGWVDFDLNQAGNVRVTIFTLQGRLVENIERDNMPSGNHQIEFDAANLTAGTYVLVLESGGSVKNGKFIVTK